jgi:hypothetical protein
LDRPERNKISSPIFIKEFQHDASQLRILHAVNLLSGSPISKRKRRFCWGGLSFIQIPKRFSMNESYLSRLSH